MNAVSRLPGLPRGLQPALVADPRGFASSSILGGFATRADADMAAIALRMLFRLPPTAAENGATGGPKEDVFPVASFWVASTMAGMAVF